MFLHKFIKWHSHILWIPCNINILAPFVIALSLRNDIMGQMRMKKPWTGESCDISTVTLQKRNSVKNHFCTFCAVIIHLPKDLWNPCCPLNKNALQIITSFYLPNHSLINTKHWQVKLLYLISDKSQQTHHCVLFGNWWSSRAVLQDFFVKKSWIGTPSNRIVLGDVHSPSFTWVIGKLQLSIVLGAPIFTTRANVTQYIFIHYSNFEYSL